MLKGMMEDYHIRVAEAHDTHVIAGQRAAMFRDMGILSPEEHELLVDAGERWIAGLLADRRYAGWLVEHGSVVVAGSGILIREWMPVPQCCRVGKWAHIANVYTDPKHRRRGLARRLMTTMLDWCASERFDHVTLAASSEGRPLYESLGFAPTSEMKLSRPL